MHILQNFPQFIDFFKKSEKFFKKSWRIFGTSRILIYEAYEKLQNTLFAINLAKITRRIWKNNKQVGIRQCSKQFVSHNSQIKTKGAKRKWKLKKFLSVFANTISYAKYDDSIIYGSGFGKKNNVVEYKYNSNKKSKNNYNIFRENMCT